MRLAFEIGDASNIIERIIEFRTSSNVCHAELLFSDGKTFSIDIQNGARYTDGKFVHYDAQHWIVVDVGAMNELALRAKCDELKGKHYDVIGLFAFLANSKDPDADKRSFCSMLCVQILQEIEGIWKFVEASRISPGALLLMAQSWGEALERKQVVA